MFEEAFITRRTNLKSNDSLSAYNGWPAQQHYNVFRTFYSVLENVKPLQILEIGTALGGFTQFLDFACKDLSIDCSILSYDIAEQPWYNNIQNNKLTIKIENVFKNDYTIVKNEVIEFINRSGTTMVLCDGGNKVAEFNLLSRYLKTNDIIMAHDYAPNNDYFQGYINNITWNWHEIQDSDIQDACEANNLVPFMPDTLTPVVWVGRKKI
jgi:cephalosporin hydroxylase